MMLWAVHISDYVLTKPWEAGGFVVAVLLLWFSARRLRDEEIPRIAILTAAFFVSSMIHIRVGPTSIHLLLTGLVGVVLGPRSALAIFVGLLLQVLLIGHGGYLTIGVNTCVMTLPALIAYAFFQLAHRIPWIKRPMVRVLLVAVGAILWFLSGVYSVTLIAKLIANTSLTQLNDVALELASDMLFNPWIIGGMLLFAIGAIALERRLENTPEFPLGFLIGELAVLLTVGLNCVVLIAGGETNWPIAPLLLVIGHLPFAVVEGVILGFVVGFLTKVKPEMLGLKSHGGHGEPKQRSTAPTEPSEKVKVAAD